MCRQRSELERLAVGGIDVVVTDLALRDRSGLQLAAAVKERSPGSAVVLLTGWGRRLHEERVRGAGVDVMVVKPVQPERVPFSLPVDVSVVPCWDVPMLLDVPGVCAHAGPKTASAPASPAATVHLFQFAMCVPPWGSPPRR